MFLIFDTETTGLPRKWDAPISDTDNWPKCVQIAWQLHDENGKLIEHKDFIIKPEGFTIPYDAEQIHGISTQLATEKGEDLATVLNLFNTALEKTKFIVGQNLDFDIKIMGCEFFRNSVKTTLTNLPVLDTCTETTANLCQIPGGRGGKFKLPSLTELHQHLFHMPFAEAHNATADVEATARCFFELIRLEVFTKEELEVEESYFKTFKEINSTTIQVTGIKHLNLKEESAKLKKDTAQKKATPTTISKELKEANFAHLHCHTRFSVLQSTTDISALIKAAAKNNQNAVAITDTGNMMGAFYFVSQAISHNKSIQKYNANLTEGETPKPLLKPIVGCEFFVCENHVNKSYQDNGYQMVFLAKNKEGYHNLAKMSSISHTKGFYYVPRIDKSIIKEHKENLMVLSGNLYGEIPNKILNEGEKQAEEALLWWKNEFKDDFYLEIMRHGQENENHVNQVLLQFAKKHQIKTIATNNTYYTEKTEAEAHDVLLCVKDNEKIDTPKGRGRGYRYGLPNNEYYFKSSEQMKELFKDIPQAIINIQEIIDKTETYSLARDVLLPKFTIPEEFKNPQDDIDGGVRGENAYLKHLTFEGAKKRWGKNLTPEITERLNFELEVIEMTGYPGYFLIVWDFISEARKMKVSVGPGRGSAAGSAVAYCLKITNIDPIKYDLLFERFLNPDRVSLPDIDIDFDDEGRQKVIDFVIDKYGTNQVAQIITYGTMAAKSSVRDTARVLDLPLNDADRIAKLIPTNVKLQNIFGEDEKSKNKINKLRKEEVEKVEELKRIAKESNLESKTINQARALEGSLRNTGTHACGIIITPEDITNLIPIARAKESEMFVTQFDNNVVESAGLLKMDFLGLKTLTLIKDTVKIIKAIHNIDIIPDEIPLDDTKTYELFKKGETIGIFQYESPGMQKHMKELKPTEFGDLIAMNALYRPGPMDYIPSFVRRKHGTEEIKYDLPEMEEYLSETYGITVYQEQVMLLSQKLANFTKGEADQLRKAMGKKILALLEKLKPKFLEGGTKNGHSEKILEKIWKDWEAFAAYAFNKSHSTCYAYIAYQTAYLKAHYPAEFMAAVLSNNMNDIKQVTFFMEECKRIEIPVLGPDVNESYYKFAVNQQGAIRFGMGAIKGVGAAAVDAIVEERKENGNYHSIFDLTKRIDLRAANKKAFDGLIMAGALDSFSNTHRAQYYQTDEKGTTFLEKAVRYGNKYQENKNSAQISLFGEASEIQFPEPEIPPAKEWGIMEKLSKEKELIGIYISGHPLDDFKNEIKYYCKASLADLQDLTRFKGRYASFGGILTNVEHKISKKGTGWAEFTVEDYSGSYNFKIFGKEYLEYKHFLVPNSFLYIKIFGKEGWKDPNDIRVSFINIMLLEDLLEEFSKKITIQLKIEDITEESIANLKGLFTKYEGNKLLNFMIVDKKEKLSLNLHSQKVKIEISGEFLSELAKQQLHFKLN